MVRVGRISNDRVIQGVYYLDHLLDGTYAHFLLGLVSRLPMSRHFKLNRIGVGRQDIQVGRLAHQRRIGLDAIPNGVLGPDALLIALSGHEGYHDLALFQRPRLSQGEKGLQLGGVGGLHVGGLGPV